MDPVARDRSAHRFLERGGVQEVDLIPAPTHLDARDLVRVGTNEGSRPIIKLNNAPDVEPNAQEGCDSPRKRFQHGAGSLTSATLIPGLVKRSIVI